MHKYLPHLSVTSTEATICQQVYASSWDLEARWRGDSRLICQDGPSRPAIPGRQLAVDTIIFDLSLVSFVILMVSLLVLPERRSAASVAASAAAGA